jgi:small subunit ribosomal protein S18
MPMPKKKSRIALARARQRRYKKFVDRGPCRFCKKEGLVIDYKDVNTLERLCSQQGKLFSRKRSGNCARHQRQLKNAIKQARYVGLLPYVG